MLMHPMVGLVASILVIIGALNWGLVGLFGIDLVARVFGAGSVLSRVIYSLVGLGGVVLLLRMF
jgi:hypothetical protein